MKGIVLAGGTGSRLHPVTMGISKQLVPIYDKPMIFYPLSVLMMSGIIDIVLISTPEDIGQFESLLGDGSNWGLNIQYVVQPSPDGLAQAFTLTEHLLKGEECALILGDNIFYGHDLQLLLKSSAKRILGATVFSYHVSDPRSYGVVEQDGSGKVISIEEKPEVPKSNYAVTGLYFYNKDVFDLAKEVRPSKRGEYEITDLNNMYLSQGNLHVEQMGRGFAWLDTGTHENLLEAALFVSTLQKRQGLKIACLEEIALNLGLIDLEQFLKLAASYGKSSYGEYLRSQIK